MIFLILIRKISEQQFTFQIFEYSFADFCFLLADGNRTVRTARIDSRYSSYCDRYVVDLCRCVVHADLAKIFE